MSWGVFLSTKLFTFSVTHQKTLYVSYGPDKLVECISSLIKSLQSWFEYALFTFMIASLQPSSFLSLLVHIAHCSHQLSISGTVWHWWQGCILCRPYARAHAQVSLSSVHANADEKIKMKLKPDALFFHTPTYIFSVTIPRFSLNLKRKFCTLKATLAKLVIWSPFKVKRKCTTTWCTSFSQHQLLEQLTHS